MDPVEPEPFRVKELRRQAAAQYPTLWDKIIQEWSSDSARDTIWLTYSANYLARTKNIRWAIDPYTLAARLPISPTVDSTEGLKKLDFVLLTHAHADHLDTRLISELRQFPIQWIIPDFMTPELIEIGLPANSIIIPTPGRDIHISGMIVLPFEARHFNIDSQGEFHGVPEMGYLVSNGDERWLFPGDIRDYDPAWLPTFDGVDTVFAHLWLGRGAAELEEPPLLEEFCRFYAAIEPKEIVVTHQYELGRKANNLWKDHHFELVKTRMKQINPAIKVTSAVMGDCVELPPQ